MTEQTTWDRADVEDVIRTQAETDAAFRAKLIADPRAAIAELFRAEPKAGLSFSIIEEQPGEVVLVLPAAKDELSLAELDQASGGATYTITVNNRSGQGSHFAFLPNPRYWIMPGGGLIGMPPFSWWG
ncbi:NHLP leader peptide family natural product precursor [Pannonibacter tanglangensis]|uniref:NHLP leader peptide family natural product n=1 Tax=Pannonibacter tanglangensis TaxID=2750084 RepID=A0ABW9ZC74_9HYPH|nr:NHLP leader peptide family natural product precursor [Pannonibacter sp. XCT-34]NBN62253.1 NHLP leader peptide family natural product precursor [Pannonibacter sp. XCT-34]